MNKSILIVESPAKAKIIAKYLNSNENLKHFGKFEVFSSMGHIRDLEKKNLGIDIDNNFLPKYIIIDNKKDLVKNLINKIKDADMVWLASDYDREGESIAFHLKETLKLKKYKRITFTEITPKALENAILHPRLIDERLVDAQETRRFLDRIVGFKLSPLLWKQFKSDSWSGLSAGRVQSAVLNLIIDKEVEISNFESLSYWHYLANFVLKLSNEEHNFSNLDLYKGNTILKITDKNQTLKILNNIQNNYSISNITQKEIKKSPDMPFITSSLQQEANSKLGFSLKKTMTVAQELYEKGYITYMRTDSYNISDDFKKTAQDFIYNKYGSNYWSGGIQKKSVKNSQEAHEAIRPTNIKLQEDELKLSNECNKLYTLIRNRTIAYFMSQCIMDELSFHITDSSFNSDMFFKSTISKIKFNGYMIVYGYKNENYDFNKFLNIFKENKYKLINEYIKAKNTWTNPPARFNESSLVKILEKEGIGRPSTYSNILTKLFDKNYIIKTDIKGNEKTTIDYIYKNNKIEEKNNIIMNGEEKSKLIPTNTGIEINKFLEKNFDYILDKTFTANMESDLDKIALGEKNKESILNIFWKKFNNDLSKYTDKIQSVDKINVRTENRTYKINGNIYIIRQAKYGPVIEYKDNNQTKYINLKSYMQLTKKQISDIDKNDIELLLNTPIDMGKIDNINAYLTYGPYGFYIKYNNLNINLPYKTTINFIKNKELSSKDIKSAIDYYHKKNKKSTDIP